ncbi:integrase domain protein SAM domain protein [Deinococcus aerius]|uniref:Integrase domain protein SAM domain protein n=1 Tax=Deinococcus aerius TaxID=200253 RepID=A0A2I9CZZ9_9DEIO|nr:site-specific integrase [Deinococcus aerius]GBF07843.1 integrase domain protein SAM domain protein [Deinococcus aerius]
MSERSVFEAALRDLPNTEAEKVRRALLRHDLDAAWPLVRRHLPDARENPVTLKNTLSGIRKLVTFAQESGESLLAPTPGFAARYLASIAHHAPATQRVLLSRARALYHALRELRVVGPGFDPFAEVRGPELHAPPGEEKVVYGEDEVARLVAHAGVEDRALVLLGADAGLTTGETARLCWEDLDLAGDHLRVHGREIVASERLTDALRAWAARGEGVLYARGSLFSLTDHAIRARLYKLCRKANVEYRAWRALRHRYALRLWQETGDPQRVADQLGLGTLIAVRPYVRLEGRLRRQAQEGSGDGEKPG